MELEFDVHVDANALYDYMLRHTFYKGCGDSGKYSRRARHCCRHDAAVSDLCDFRRGGFTVSAGVFMGCVQRNRRCFPVFKEPLHYKMTEEGVEVSQKETQQFQKWEDMYRAVSTGKSLILYTDKTHASIFPRKDLGRETVCGNCNDFFPYGAWKGAGSALKGGRKEVAMIIESLCCGRIRSHLEKSSVKLQNRELSTRW